MPLMGSLWVGNSGLSTAQNALNTTAHNVTNADTKGYTREQILQSTKRYVTVAKTPKSAANQQVGLGVNYARTEQIRDVFLDQAYRKESGRSAFYETSLNTLNQVEDILGEMDGAEFNESLKNLWVAVQELSKDPTSATAQGLLVNRAQEFIEHGNAVYDSIKAYQQQLNSTVNNMVKQINGYAEQVKTLNDQIMKIEAGGVEVANDLRDQRNHILDQLGELANISYQETFDGAVTIRIEENDLLKADRVFAVEAYMDPETGFYTPIWSDWVKRDTTGKILPSDTKDANGSFVRDADGLFKNIKEAQVFDLQKEISTELDSDVGKLKSILLSRGSKHATWEDIPQEPVQGETEPDADYKKRLEDYEKAADLYNLTVAPSICMNVMGEFDTLVHTIVDKVNQAIDDGGYSLDDGSQLFVMKFPEDGLTIDNLQVNPQLLKEPTKLSFKTKDGRADYAFTEKLKDIFTDESYVLNPNVATKVNLRYFYNSLVNQVANSASVADAIHQSEQDTLNSVEEARQSVSGVSTDEELQFMIMFQNAYNASSRYINVVNEMLEHLLNSLT